jgi:hypothetical protein
VNSDWTVSHFTAGTRQPYSIEASAILRIERSGRSPLTGVKPRSRMSRNATPNITPRMTPRSTNGAPRLTCSARKPPATEPVSIATPLTTWPRPKTDSSAPSNPVAPSASTSHASTAPEKNVKPRPMSSETAAHAPNGAAICHSRT